MQSKVVDHAPESLPISERKEMRRQSPQTRATMNQKGDFHLSIASTTRPLAPQPEGEKG